ncbi:hypothetical protein BAP_1754 [Bacillus sp. CN2]|nr:hypothetical protein BAP_1754 [Bacillus sp. CN2]
MNYVTHSAFFTKRSHKAAGRIFKRYGDARRHQKNRFCLRTGFGVFIP